MFWRRPNFALEALRQIIRTCEELERSARIRGDKLEAINYNSLATFARETIKIETGAS